MCYDYLGIPAGFLLVRTQRPPCVKGAVKNPVIFDWGIVLCRYVTILPSEIKDFVHLPLHKGALKSGTPEEVPLKHYLLTDQSSALRSCS